MTREEAAIKLTMHLANCGMLMPEEWLARNGPDSELQQAFQMAVDALREQEQREQGCDYCQEFDDPCGVPLIAAEDSDPDRGIYLYNGSLCANGGEFCSANVRFCPMCGHKLEGRLKNGN